MPINLFTLDQSPQMLRLTEQVGHSGSFKRGRQKAPWAAIRYTYLGISSIEFSGAYF